MHVSFVTISSMPPPQVSTHTHTQHPPSLQHIAPFARLDLNAPLCATRTPPHNSSSPPPQKPKPHARCSFVECACVCVCVCCSSGGVGVAVSACVRHPAAIKVTTKEIWCAMAFTLSLSLCWCAQACVHKTLVIIC